MKKSYETMKLFYQNVGKLFYAVAYADKVVREEEIVELKKVIETVWLPLEDTEDEFGMDNAFNIEFMFQYLNDNKESAEQCFKDFQLYAKANKTMFSEYIIEITINTCIAIADSFAGTNKAEKKMIDNLSDCLYSLNVSVKE